MYDYSDIKLTCPFCKSEMEFETILVDQEYDMPYFIDYICSNNKCQFELRLDFDEFDNHFRRNKMEFPDNYPKVIDIWLEKIRRGWKIKDAPNEAIRKELRKRLDGKENENKNYR